MSRFSLTAFGLTSLAQKKAFINAVTELLLQQGKAIVPHFGTFKYKRNGGVMFTPHRNLLRAMKTESKTTNE